MKKWSQAERSRLLGVVKEDLVEKITFEQGSEGCEGTSQVDNQGEENSIH